ncbi:MAG: DNA-processing protein DprA [Clostridiales bacterium]|jgi:DNA processing protein|nr:DNA-processing protein DprA [Clostridiales bacterium]
MTNERDRLDLLFLTGIEGMTQKKIVEALEVTEASPSELLGQIEKFKARLLDIFGEPLYHLTASLNNGEYKNGLLSALKNEGANFVTFLDDGYPENLREIPDFPIILYYKGDAGLLNGRLFSIVGTRNPSAYGRRVTKEFAEELACAGFVIVSGLARGVDSIAHRAALDNNMPTVAVCATGIDAVYPAENRGLAAEIIESGGLIITEYKPKTPPMSYHFPHRNRIISALSRSVLVTEAGENSGSLITVNYAVDQGKNVYIVPGGIYAAESKGANKFLKKFQGALVTEVNDILEDNNLCGRKRVNNGIELDLIENLIVTELEKGEKHFDELLSLTGLEIGKLNAILMSLTMIGQIEETGNNYYYIAK